MRRLLAALLLGAAPAAAQPAPPPVAAPLVIAHRGASGYRPEHTLEAYELAARQGADYLEADLVSTRDGVLVCRHDADLGPTTDVAQRFPGRRATRVIEGDTLTGWFVDDFTLAELRTLRARERFEGRSHRYDALYGIPTFEELLQLVARLREGRLKPLGVYPELKHPAYFRARGVPMEERLVALLDRYGYTGDRDAAFIQSFDLASLSRVRELTRLRLVLLLGAGDTIPDLGRVAAIADGLGVDKRLILPEGRARVLLDPTTLVRDAHARGLLVHAWTFRREPAFLAPAWAGDARAELRRFRALGVDGVFTDFPDVALEAFGSTR
ncbi:MAG: glycerophosphodiester phosphodiesterase family protein [Gemmatimonadales bacterium]|nr:glycerophosphodiester phosphodiesterase family protein [Gemmatimonadales bacterium]